MEKRRLKFWLCFPDLVFLGICISVAGPASSSALAATDPTRPKEYPVSTEDQTRAGKPITRPRLTSVLIAPNRRLAVIDGRLMAQGQSGGGLQVKKIMQDRVILRVKGQTKDLTLTLGNPNMQKELRE